MMKGAVIYKTWWGSNRRVAEAIAAGLCDSGHEVTLAPVEEAGEPDPSLDFVVIGAATRWPGAWPKIKRYARGLGRAGFAGKPFATFSTGGTLTEENPNRQASEVLHKLLASSGLKPLAPPLKIAIEGYKPPGTTHRGTLPESEVERAREFGRDLGEKLSGS